MPLRFSYNNRSDYDIVRVEHDRIFIIDLDLGHKSVTNDAENVYSELQFFWPGRRIIYRDSQGTWDEIVKAPPYSLEEKEGEKRPVFVDSFDMIHFIPYKEHLPNI